MTIELKGHLDTSKVSEVKTDIDNQLAKADASEHIIIDCNELNFISSSGLRILLTIKKTHPNMDVVNVNTEVYNVFEMTGFTRILDVKKALRKINLAECRLIGEGGNGAVYRINDEEIVKVSKFSNSDATLIHESQMVREAFLMGVPTVISFDIVDCGKNRKGIVMEALDSQSLGSYIAEDTLRMDDIVSKYVELFRQANTIQTDSPLYPNIKEKMRSLLFAPTRIINDEEAELLSGMLDEIPDSNHFIHFDGHVGNVLMHGAKDDRNLMLIDMGDAGIGHPLLEIVGFGFLMLEPDYAKGCSLAEKITGLSLELNHEFSRRILAEMFHVTDKAELDCLQYQASLISRIKGIIVAQVWPLRMQDEKLKRYLMRFVAETLSLVPEIKSAIRFFVDKME